jgi:hypothetical protein
MTVTTFWRQFGVFTVKNKTKGLFLEAGVHRKTINMTTKRKRLLNEAVEFLQGWEQGPVPLAIALAKIYDVQNDWTPRKNGGYAVHLNFSKGEVKPCLEYVSPPPPPHPPSTIVGFSATSEVFVLEIPDPEEGSNDKEEIGMEEDYWVCREFLKRHYPEPKPKTNLTIVEEESEKEEAQAILTPNGSPLDFLKKSGVDFQAIRSLLFQRDLNRHRTKELKRVKWGIDCVLCMQMAMIHDKVLREKRTWKSVLPELEKELNRKQTTLKKMVVEGKLFLEYKFMMRPSGPIPGRNPVNKFAHAFNALSTSEKGRLSLDFPCIVRSLMSRKLRTTILQKGHHEEIWKQLLPQKRLKNQGLVSQ